MRRARLPLPHLTMDAGILNDWGIPGGCGLQDWLALQATHLHRRGRPMRSGTLGTSAPGTLADVERGEAAAAVRRAAEHPGAQSGAAGTGRPGSLLSAVFVAM